MRVGVVTTTTPTLVPYPYHSTRSFAAIIFSRIIIPLTHLFFLYFLPPLLTTFLVLFHLLHTIFLGLFQVRPLPILRMFATGTTKNIDVWGIASESSRSYRLEPQSTLSVSECEWSTHLVNNLVTTPYNSITHSFTHSLTLSINLSLH